MTNGNQITSVSYDPTWQKTICSRVCLVRAMACAAVSPCRLHLLQSNIQSRTISVTCLKNQSNMNACGRGMKNDLTCSSRRLNELICLLLPFKNKTNKMIQLWLILPQKCCLEKFYCESGSKADDTDHLVSVDIWLTLSVLW